MLSARALGRRRKEERIIEIIRKKLLIDFLTASPFFSAIIVIIKRWIDVQETGIRRDTGFQCSISSFLSLFLISLSMDYHCLVYRSEDTWKLIIGTSVFKIVVILSHTLLKLKGSWKKNWNSTSLCENYFNFLCFDHVLRDRKRTNEWMS